MFDNPHCKKGPAKLCIFEIFQNKILPNVLNSYANTIISFYRNAQGKYVGCYQILAIFQVFWTYRKSQ